MGRKRGKRVELPFEELPIADIVALDQEGRGVARVEGKVIFIEGALTGEKARYKSFKVKPKHEEAEAVEIFNPSAQRVTPGCPHFGRCGGCSMQHLDPAAQVATKQRVLEDALRHIGRVKPQQMLPAIHGPYWGYRHRARIGVRHVDKKGGTLVGFHERHSSYITDMDSCAVLPPRVSALIPKLRALIKTLSVREQLPQIEIAIGEDANRSDNLCVVLVMRNLVALSSDDEAALRAFADAFEVHVWLQPKGPDSVAPFWPELSALHYTLPEFQITMPYAPTEFTQVNPEINRVLVRRAIALLDPQPNERIADLFCGLGNFTLPIARRGAFAVGIEGSTVLVKRATENAATNGLAERTEYHTANLFEVTPETLMQHGPYHGILIDPPREGAFEVCKSLPPATSDSAPTRIVYVSCNPATLARDAGFLVNVLGYQFQATGIINMFPHTAHVESIAVFTKT